jgi:hypothetical protein
MTTYARQRTTVAPLKTMTRDIANEILNLWRAGAAYYPPHEINMALYVTGDLDALL